MITGELQLGDRVRVTKNYYEQCLRRAIGTVSSPPDEVAGIDARWCGIWRKEDGCCDQSVRTYWIVFDEMVLDPACQAPTDSGEIDYSGAIDAAAIPVSDLELV